MSGDMSARFNDCDGCRRQVPAPYEAVTPRPSDRFDYCCVLAFCVDCGESKATGPREGGGLALQSEWSEWTEKKGFFYS
jgi:hypothetical protein